MSTIRLGLPLACCCLAGGLQAADVSAFNDLRFFIGAETTSFDAETEVSYGSISASEEEDDDFDSTFVSSLEYVGSRGLGASGGLVYGAALHYGIRELDEDSERFELGTATIRGQIGWGYGFTPQLQLELLGYLGVGTAGLEYETDFGVDESWDGTAFEGGVNANLVYTTGGGFQFGGSLGFGLVQSSFEEEIDLGGNIGEVDYELTIEQQVGHIRIFAGFRF